MIRMISRKRLSLLMVSVILLIIYSSFSFKSQDSVETQNLEEDVFTLDNNIYDVGNLLDMPEIETVSSGDAYAAFSKDAWNLILVNKQHPISKDYPVKLGLAGNMEVDARIVDDWQAMKEAAAEDGVTILIASPYRDYERQVYLFDRKIKSYLDQGLNYIESYKYASQIVNIPGSSEHQTGLALDIVSNNYSKLNEGFARTDAGKWLAKNCQDYGFILRYPKGKEYVTSIDYEPWHFRYVGVEAAKIIMKEGITLEEFIERL